MVRVIVTSKKYGCSEIIISPCDEPLFKKYSWSLDGPRKYLQRRASKDGRSFLVRFHREILGLPPFSESGTLVDHINRNTFDNRRENLRLCNKQQNGANSGPKKGKYKGVKRNGSRGRPWVAGISPLGKNIVLGYFNTQEEAAAAYNIAAKEHFGEFAYLNSFEEEMS